MDGLRVGEGRSGGLRKHRPSHIPAPPGGAGLGLPSQLSASSSGSRQAHPCRREAEPKAHGHVAAPPRARKAAA